MNDFFSFLKNLINLCQLLITLREVDEFFFFYISFRLKTMLLNPELIMAYKIRYKVISTCTVCEQVEWQGCCIWFWPEFSFFLDRLWWCQFFQWRLLFPSAFWLRPNKSIVFRLITWLYTQRRPTSPPSGLNRQHTAYWQPIYKKTTYFSQKNFPIR